MPQALVIPAVVEIHSNECAFLYAQRKLASTSALYNLNDLFEVDKRLNGHLDGLALGGETSWELCEQNLMFEEPGEIFTATGCALRLGMIDRLDAVFKVAGDDARLLDAIADALTWSNFERVADLLKTFLLSDDVARRYVALMAFAGHRINVTELDAAIGALLQSDNPAQVQNALIATGELGPVERLAHLQAFVKHEEKRISYAANWSATRYGDAQAMENLKAFAGHPFFHEKSLQYIVMQKDVKNSVDIFKQLLADPATARYALIGLGYLGNPQSIPQIINFMRRPDLARVAGEAFSNITGVDLDATSLTTQKPADFEAGPTENPEDEDVAMDPDEDLPWPDPDKIAAWWAHPVNQKQFAGADRYLMGKPMNKAQLQYALRTGNQKQRAFAANVLGIYERDKPIFNVLAPARRQMSLLGL